MIDLFNKNIFWYVIRDMCYKKMLLAAAHFLFLTTLKHKKFVIR